jgi:V8-like Glu-specific endopeptidase
MKRTVIAIVALLIGLLSMTTSVARTGDFARVSGVPAEQFVTKEISPASQKAALDFWTREALASAQPMEIPTDRGPAGVDTAALSKQEVSGPAGSVAPAAAAPGAIEAARAAYPLDWAALEEDAGTTVGDQPDGTSGIFTSYIANKYTPMQAIYPHIWVGRLAFTVPGGTSYCSGTSIRGNVMLTAAHCLYDSTNNRWLSDNWVFTPAYRNGSAPFGTFAATSCRVLSAWINLTGGFSINSWTRHDVGVCKMGNNSSGTSLNNAVGTMGYQWDASYTLHLHDLGYPLKDYNDAYLADPGKYLRTCVAESRQQTTETRGIGCNYGGGISGGPLMINYAPIVVSGYADGVNSGIFVGQQNMYAARFNSNNIVSLCSGSFC